MSIETLDLGLPDQTGQPDATAASQSLNLLPVSGPALVSSHWSAERLQMYSWGGFHGPHIVDFATGSTLITGATGAGKSTLQDAYIAVMMPPGTAFNSASNAAVSGRARSGEQRSLLSYLRGKTDTLSDGAERTDKVLRGAGKPTWGAIAVTFISDLGARFTAMRTYWVPARAGGDVDISMRLFTIDGPVDITAMPQYASVGGDKHFPTDDLRTLWPTMKVYDSQARFAQALYTRLGIGPGGDGDRAMRLLATIQASQQIPTVDKLYKDLVLEDPDTFAKADDAIRHFDDLEAAYDAMVVQQQKVDLLTPITTLQADHVEAAQQIRDHDTLGIARDGHTPFMLWAATTHARLYDIAIDANQQAAATNQADLARLREQERVAKTSLAAANAAYADAGGSTLIELDKQIETLDAARAVKARHAAAAARAIGTLGPLPTCRPEWDQLQADGQQFLANLEASRAHLTDERDRVRGPLSTITEGIEATQAELASFDDGRQGRIPEALHSKRVQAAAVSGIPVEELKFVGELINVHPDHQQWRTAIETVLAGLATTVLVPIEKFQRLSDAIEPLEWRGRIHFAAAQSWREEEPDTDPGTIAGKLEYADGPYRGWVAEHVAAVNHRCVPSTRDLAGPGRRVTIHGQTRDGMRGAHGHIGRANVIGFTNTEMLDELNARLADLQAQRTAILEESTRLRERLADLGKKAEAYQAATNFTWDDVDTQPLDDQIVDLRGRKAQIQAADNQLTELAKQVTDLTGALDAISRLRHGAEDRADALETSRAELFTDQDAVKTNLFALEDDQSVVLDEQASARLHVEYVKAAAGRPNDLADFEANIVRVKDAAATTYKSATATLARTTRDLEDRFALYESRWHDPDRIPTAASYPEYAAILEDLVHTGLHERREEWRKRLIHWSGEDLVPLRQSLTSSVEEIFERIAAINAILAHLPFGPANDKLQITPRRLVTDQQTRFARLLTKMAQIPSTGLSDEQLEPRFRELQEFIATIRRREDPHLTKDLAATADRDRLLDVRRHVEITAHRYTRTGEHASSYQSLSGKSGGETQELVAFIVGAALRYRLGDEVASQPRFAPVFLDEGFVKSDSEFAGRAVRAWQGLGFQLVVAAPLDKVSALEPHMQRICLVTKNQASGYSFIETLTTRADASTSR